MSALLSIAGSWIDRIRVNSLTRAERGGRAVWLKKRLPAARPLLVCANGFFHAAGNPVLALVDASAWQRWEVGCFERLHAGENRRAGAEDFSVWADALPGESLSHHLDSGTLTPALLRAAGRELARAHATHCPHFHGAWSHGDPHTGNFIFDPADARARLIDFEVRHHRDLPALARHTDDLLVFLLDLAGRADDALWLPGACAFLDGYARAGTIAALAPRLATPHAFFSRLWWAVRTTWMPGERLDHRLAALRVVVG